MHRMVGGVVGVGRVRRRGMGEFCSFILFLLSWDGKERDDTEDREDGSIQ